MSFLMPGSCRGLDWQEKETWAVLPEGVTGLADPLYRPGIIGRCANPECKSGLLHLFRKRSTPVFENGWTCSAECTEARISSALQREMEGVPDAQAHHRHRIPLGLLMLEHEWITPDQLRRALSSQRSSAPARIGEWLIRQGATDEASVTRTLALQWSCPVLHPGSHALSCAPAIPRLFLEAFGALPLRIAAEKVLYLGFEESLDPVFTISLQRMLELRVESGIVASSVFRPAFEGALKAEFPTLQLAEAVSVGAAAHLLARAVERSRPVASRLVRVHEFVWLRMWRSHNCSPLADIGSISDVICSIGSCQVHTVSTSSEPTGRRFAGFSADHQF